VDRRQARDLDSEPAAATVHRDPAEQGLGDGHQPDQGAQYGADAWRRLCRSNRLEPSMSRKGNCWGTAVAEAFFSTLKKELIYKSRDFGEGRHH
jgi:transposase InsO family protein